MSKSLKMETKMAHVKKEIKEEVIESDDTFLSFWANTKEEANDPKYDPGFSVAANESEADYSVSEDDLSESEAKPKSNKVESKPEGTQKPLGVVDRRSVV